MKNSDNHWLFNKVYPHSYHPYLLKPLDIWIALGLFLVSLAVYFKTLNPSVTAGDSGELITTVYNMGASHPPGFPLYGIIGKLFTFLRFPDIGYKLNIFSAISAASAVLFAYLSLVKLLGFNRHVQNFSLSVHLPAIAASLVFAFSKTHWSQAVMAEVYALNAALISILFFVMILWYEEIICYREDQESLWLAPRMSLLLAFIMGLSITNHQIPVWYIIAWILMLIPIIYLLVSLKGSVFVDQFTRKIVPLVLFAVICGIALLFLVIAAIKPYLLFPEIANGQYRLVFPSHVPFILTAILCVPVWLTLYITQCSLYNHVRSMKKVWFDCFHGLFWLCLVGVVISYFYFLGPIHGLFVSLPSLIIAFWQLIQRDESDKYFSKNWMDQFFLIMTAAMWLLVFAISIYLYMWIRAKAIAPLSEPKPLSWGDTQTIDILVNHMLRKQYPVGIDDYSNLLGQLYSLLQYHVAQFGVINFVLGFFGLFYFLKRETIQGTYFILASIIYFWSIVDFINFEVNPRSLETQEVFFIQQFLIYSFFIGFAYQGLFDLPQWISKILNQYSFNRKS